MLDSPKSQGPTIQSEAAAERHPLTALVISYNRGSLIRTCLAALGFADEIVVVDKSSTDGTAEIAAGLADRVITVPWTPTVEDTRAFALAQCSHDWILCLDDDECLSPDAIEFFYNEMAAPRAKLYMIPQRHYILGRHDEDAYYWPEYQMRFFHRDSVEIRPVVHGGIVARTDDIYKIPLDSGVCVYHLSHADTARWIEKANRYTSVPNRQLYDDGSSDLIAFAHSRIDGWAGISTIKDRGSYPAAVAVLRAVYDIIDRIKLWESEDGLVGEDEFQKVCRSLEAAYERLYSAGGLPRPARHGDAAVELLGRGPDHDNGSLALGEQLHAMQRDARHLRKLLEDARAETQRAVRQERDAAYRAVRQECEAAITQAVASARASEKALAQQFALTEAVEAENRELRLQLDAIRSSEFWRATAPARLLAGSVQRAAAKNLLRLQILRHAAKPENVVQRRIVLQALRRRLGLGPRNGITRAPHVPSGAISSQPVPQSLENLAPHQAAVASYPIWSLRFDTPSPAVLRHFEATADDMPHVMIVVRFSRSTWNLVGSTVKAISATAGVRWNATFVSDSPEDPDFLVACKEAIHEDQRFGFALPADTGASIVVVLEAGAVPKRHGVRLLVDHMVQHPDLAMVYADEDELAANGTPADPWFKPEYSPLLAEQGKLFGRMFAFRAEPGRGFLPAERFVDTRLSSLELALGAVCGLPPGRIGHVPHVAFHNVLPAVPVRPLRTPAMAKPPVVSILIPTRDRWDLLGPCLRSLGTTDWPLAALDIIVIDNGSTDSKTLEELATAEAAGRISVLRDDRKFNYSGLNNAGARVARGEVLVFLNNDTEVIDPAWLRKLVAYAVQPDIGAVGAKLLYADRTVQHAGVTLGIQGTAAHAHVFLDSDAGGYQGLANLTREVSSVTGACMAVSRRAFEEVGGFREELEVAFNDTALCLDLRATGRRNIYAAECTLIHHESKTRGFDTTPQQIATARREALRCWQYHADVLRNDPYYSPNLSLELPFQLAFAPRRRAAWRREPATPLTVMLLSSTYARGHGVAVVIELQVRALRGQGHEVIRAGVKSDRDFSDSGTDVVDVRDSRSVATLAVDREVDVIVVHTPPFFSVARWTGAFPPVIAYDHGEPPPDVFPDAEARREVLAEKNTCLAMCRSVVAISEAVANESAVPPTAVIPNGNSHLGTWSPAYLERRNAVRRNRGWEGRDVVLNVSRFHEGERHYKGIDRYADMLKVTRTIDPALASRCIFVLCGKGDERDVAKMQDLGLTVFANVSDEELVDLYAAADIYANFSQWEGYNLGIGQALAMGLPVIASDIPAHRAFGVPVTDNPVAAVYLLRDQLAAQRERVPRVWSWDGSLGLFVQEVERVGGLAPAVR